MTPRSLIAADRRHHTCLRDAREHCRPLQAAPSTGQKKLRVLMHSVGPLVETHPKTVSDTVRA